MNRLQSHVVGSCLRHRNIMAPAMILFKAEPCDYIVVGFSLRR